MKADAALVEKVLAAIHEDGEGKKKLSCAKGLALANELGVPPKTIGTICDDHGVRITGCQLGCFG